MDYEKAYKAVLKTATQWIKDGCTDKEKICLECVFPELRESEDERMRKAALAGIEYLEREIGWDVIDDIDILDVKDYLEKQKELPFVKDVILGYPGLYFYDGERMHFRGPTMEEKQKELTPADGWDYADKRMSHPLYLEGFEAGRAVERELSEFEKQKEPKELPLMGGNADLYFDEWNQQKQNPTKRQCFEEGMRYAQRLQKEQKPAEINVKALLAADRLASAEMTGRLKERSEILENPEKYGLLRPADWGAERCD